MLVLRASDRPFLLKRAEKSSSSDSLTNMQQSQFSGPNHKRTHSDAQKMREAEPRSHPAPRHKRSYSQNFDSQSQPLPQWKRRSSPPLEAVEEEDCSDSEEAIRKILRERGTIRASLPQTSITGLQASMTSLLSQRQEEARRTDSARSRMKQAVLQLIHEAESRTDTPETVVTMKSSVASAATVLEAESSLLDFRPEEHKEFEGSFSKGSEADNTVIADAEVLVDSDMSNSQVFKPNALQRFKPNNHKLIKNAIIAICLAGDANKKAREEVLRIVSAHRSLLNFVIAFKGTLGRHELGALYEHDLAAGYLQKLYGPPVYPEQVTAALVQSCYRYDSSAREFRYLLNRRFAFGMDAVSLHRRL